MAPGRKGCPGCALLEGKCARHKNAYSRRNCLDCAAMPGRCEAHRRSGRNACKREACLKHQQNLDRQATEDNDDEDAMDVDSTVQPNVKLKLGVDNSLRYPLPPEAADSFQSYNPQASMCSSETLRSCLDNRGISAVRFSHTQQGGS